MKVSNQIFYKVVDFVDETRMKAFNSMVRNLSMLSTRRIAASCKGSVSSCQRRASSSVSDGKFRFEEFFKNLLYSGHDQHFLRKPVTEAQQEEGGNDSLRFSVTSMQGWRAHQEDAHNCILEFSDGCSLFAVYDGHGGSEVARYASKNLPSFIKKTGSLKAPDIAAALKHCFAQFDQSLKQKEVVQDKVIVANVGDTRAVLCRDGFAIDLSVDHKPEDALEHNRIMKAGGTVTRNGRVNGVLHISSFSFYVLFSGLNLSRALGDHTYKNRRLEPEAQMISPVPDVLVAELVPEDSLLVVACDGIWNCMSSQEVMDFINARIDSMTLSEIGQEICFFCCASDTIGGGSGYDNMTVIIVQLERNE
uniref:protein-serine/threonine phosphatase n=1 Tax=Ditylenchus dipsaci TaxID=166011 RepID=A0A915E9Q6_9BILA